MDFKDSTGSIRRQALKQKIKVCFLKISQPADVKKKGFRKNGQASFFPHLPQNFAPGRFGFPQNGHAAESAGAKGVAGTV
jgi:hypothetical protein